MRITDLRKASGVYLKVAMKAAGMSAEDIAQKLRCRESTILQHVRAANVLPLQRILKIEEITGVSPDSCGLMVHQAMRCVEAAWEALRSGHCDSLRIAYAAKIGKGIVDRAMSDKSTSLDALLRFGEGWIENDAAGKLSDPEFLEQIITSKGKAVLVEEMMRDYVHMHWGGMESSFRLIRSDLCTWESDALYRFELERMREGNFVFRAIWKKDERLSVERDLGCIKDVA